jgi:hypothetical protein
MKLSDLITIGSVALGTAAVTVATLGTGSLEAGKGDAPGVINSRPKLVAHGVELSLASVNGQVFKAGDEPSFELTALNTNSQPANLCVRLAMSASSPADLTSRIVMAPAMICQEEHQLTLQPHETKTLVIAPKAKLPENKFISVFLSEVNELKEFAKAPALLGDIQPVLPVLQPGSIAMLNFSTVVPKAPGQVLVRLEQVPSSAKGR